MLHTIHRVSNCCFVQGITKCGPSQCIEMCRLVVSVRISHYHQFTNHKSSKSRAKDAWSGQKKLVSAEADVLVSRFWPSNPQTSKSLKSVRNDLQAYYFEYLYLTCYLILYLIWIKTLLLEFFRIFCLAIEFNIWTEDISVEFTFVKFRVR